MVMHECDSNAILSTPLKSRVAGELTKAWTKLRSKLQANGCAPEIHILDKECSAELKAAFKKCNLLSNSPRRICIAPTQPNEPSKHGRTISARA
jgi:hypothetical protein